MRGSSKRWSALVLVALAAVARGCSTFSEADPSPSDDAGAEAEAGVLEGGTDSPSAPSCVPRDIAEDAGSPDASCEGTQKVDLAASDKHCGVCGHSCLSDGCQSGQCRVVEVVPIPFVANNPPAIGTITGGFIYFAHASEIARAPLTGGAPTTLLVAAAVSANSLGPPLVAQGRLWSVADQSKLVSAALDGTDPKTEATESIAFIATDGKNLYWATSGNQVKAVGNPTPLIDDSNIETIYAMAADSGGIYLLVHMKGTIAARARLIVRGPAATDSVQEILDDVVGGTALAIAGDYLYWADFAGDVWRIRKTSNAKEPVTRFPLPGFVKGFVVDDTSVYLSTTPESIGGSVNAQFYSAPSCGGPARLLRSDFIYASMFGQGGYLYWTHSDGIYRIAK
jgi:hypothetical protein